MKNVIVVLMFFFISLQTALAAELPQYSLKYDPTRDAFQDGRDAIKLATLTKRRILVEIGGDWCKWCHLIDRFLNKHPKIKTQLHQNFVLLKVNVSAENNNHEFLKSFPKFNGYPHMFVMHSDGQLLSSKDPGEFLHKHKYSIARFEDFFKRWAIKERKAHG